MFSYCSEVAKYALLQKLNEMVSNNTRLKLYCAKNDWMRRLLELTLTEDSGPVLGQVILLVRTVGRLKRHCDMILMQTAVKLGLFTFGVGELKSMFRMLQSVKGVR